MIFSPLCGESYSDLSQYKNDYFVNYGNPKDCRKSHYYLYQIEEGSVPLIGILGTISLFDDDTDNKIYEHESVNQTKVEAYAQQFLECTTQLSPIMVTTPAILPDLSVDKSKVLYRSSDAKHTLFFPDERTQTLLSKQLSSVKELYILDGHHRASAFRKIGTNFILAILIPEQRVNIGVISRLLKFSDMRKMEEVLGTIENDTLFDTSFCDGFKYNAQQDSFVICSSEGSFHVNPKNNLSNFESYDYIESIIIKYSEDIDHLEYIHQEYEKCSKTFCQLEERDLLIQLPRISYPQFINLVHQKKKVGVHTTYFYPKPLHGFIKFNIHEPECI